MEKRFIAFILICLVAFPLYYRLVLPPPPEPDPNASEPTHESTVDPRGTDPSTPGGTAPPVRPEVPGPGEPGAVPEPAVSRGSDLPDFPLESIVMENDVLRIDVRSEGAGIHSATLLAYREEDRETELTLASPELRSGTGLVLRLTGIQGAGVDGAEIPLDTVRWEVIERSSNRVVFRYPLGEQGAVTKAIELPPEGYEVVVEVTVDGAISAARDARYQLLGPERIRYEVGSRFPNQRVIGLLDPRGRFADTTHEAVGPLPQRMRIVDRSVAWGGLESNYFAWVIRPEAAGEASAPRLVEIGDPDKSRADQYADANEAGRQRFPFRVGFQQEIVAGRTDVYRAFLGPKDRTVLSAFEEYGYIEMIDYGSLGALVRLFLFLMRTFESITSSWGISIILLTVLVKLLLHPMNKRNQRTMQRQQKKMAKIQPEMKALKEKHKNDPLKANQEIQKLFKEHGVNPAQMFGGCLMIFLQLPIWIGLINTFRLAIEIRQEPFLWVSDLTAPDELFEMPFSLPFLGSWFNLLPVLYVIVTLINQRMMPRSDDPQMRQQQKMMTFMMVAFGFIFYSFPSGLMVYFLTSASLGILEQRIIRAELRHEDAKLAAEAAAAPPPAPKPGQKPGKPKKPGKVKRRT